MVDLDRVVHSDPVVPASSDLGLDRAVLRGTRDDGVELGGIRHRDDTGRRTSPAVG